MVKIIIKNNVRSKIEGELTPTVRTQLDKQLSYHVDGYFFSPRYKRKQWDGKTHLFSKISQSFQSGCFYIVAKILKDYNIPFEIEDNRKVIKKNNSLPLYSKELRDYQEVAKKALLDRTRGVLIAGTGAGKTLILTAIVGTLNLPTIIYVHTCDLLHQMKDTVEEVLRIKCGQIGDGLIDIQQINVATIQTASRAILGTYEKESKDDAADDETNISTHKEQIINLIKTCNVVIIDETHHASSSSIQAVMKKSEQAYYRYGVTATLREKGDDLLINGIIGRVIHKIRASELIRAGWLIRPTIYFYEVDFTLKQQQGTYQSIYKNCIIENEYRNKLIVDSAFKFKNSGKKILILVKQINHGNRIMEELYDHMNIRFLQSKVNSEDRSQMLEDFRAGELDCLVATSLAWEESLLIKEKGFVRHIQIGEFIDFYLKEEGIKNIEGIEVLTKDKGKTTWKQIYAVVKHKRKNKILQVTTERGHEVRVTENHSLIGKNDEKVKPEIGNEVQIATNFELPEKLKEIDLVQEFVEKLPNIEKNRVRVELYGENLSQSKRRLMRSEWKCLTNQTMDYSTKRLAKKRLAKIENPERYKKFLNWFWKYVEYKRGRNKTSQYSCSIVDASKCEVDIEEFCDARIYYHRRTVVFLPLKLKITKALIRILGYYVSEGSKGEYGKRTGWKINLAANLHTEETVKQKYKDNSKHNKMMRWKAEIRKDMKKSFDSLLNTGISEEKIGICTNNKLTYLLFTYVFECKELAENKDIPPIVFNISTKLKWEFINAYLRRDGHYCQKSNEIVFSSCSYKLICGLSLLLRSLSCTRIRIHKRLKEKILLANFDLYCLYCNDPNYQGPISELIELKSTRTIQPYVKIKKTIEFHSIESQFVYDICVPGVERFICGSGLCASNTLADEGLDLPILDAVILAGSGMSKVKAMQRIGRAIRKYPGKDKAFIIDFMDKAKYLRKHSEERLKIFQEEEEFLIKIQKKV